MPALPSPADEAASLLAALALQHEWGVDVALSDDPVNGFALQDTSSTVAGVPHAAPAPRSKHIPRPPTENDPQLASPLDAPTIDAFVSALRAFRSPPLARTATHAVTPVHVATSRWMVIGEVPQADEDRSGVVLTGPENALFEPMLRAIGLSRAELSLAPAIPWRPPGGRDISRAEMQSCRPLLQHAIRLCAPERLLLLGQTPVRLLFGDEVSLTRFRGKWKNAEIEGLGPIPALATRHPMQLAALPRARREVWTDLLTFVETIESDAPSPRSG